MIQIQKKKTQRKSADMIGKFQYQYLILFSRNMDMIFYKTLFSAIQGVYLNQKWSDQRINKEKYKFKQAFDASFLYSTDTF